MVTAGASDSGHTAPGEVFRAPTGLTRRLLRQNLVSRHLLRRAEGRLDPSVYDSLLPYHLGIPSSPGAYRDFHDLSNRNRRARSRAPLTLKENIRGEKLKVCGQKEGVGGRVRTQALGRPTMKSISFGGFGIATPTLTVGTA